jgi:hypothetical protein
MLAQAPELSA